MTRTPAPARSRSEDGRPDTSPPNDQLTRLAAEARASWGGAAPPGPNEPDAPRPAARRDGQLLADDLADLIVHGPKVPLDVTEAGLTVPAMEFAWTNIGADDAFFSAVNHCKEWTSEALLPTARAGKISPASAAELPAWKVAHHWTSDATLSCITLAHLYCFED